ncbi:peptide-N4-asparagine amidase A [Streptomyces sp. LBUM 1478]|uniref:peptide-N4-asparagine amidase n=1 Tax=Streptomyces scabiei TaxID=1930 RepID=UPI000765CDF4|nr:MULTISPECIES: peptide-N4-asparagine amidase [Streptomyces]MBP5865308.1 peptide-N4-asparagine amidase A [Streptomyces sp. LBUM 1484]MBP5909840.1 peptide-N4-asparagine amidase A [Streptomyces sp. LBUM 1478]MBP5933373.1 peptide-N4-asparagine amidase A [Streptomyces sp. LBUM 1479]MBP5881721.1 peptide-N4-asparagine amidase A [Streptomyces sp. LBUM 1487]MBP5895408.1 peptide-N4-asparagine amidase A [Streptomyces sp. LBUM 1481]
MRSRIFMSMFTGATLLVGTLLGAGTARSADVPAEFGTDWHDPVTAAPPVTVPAHGRSCEVTVAEARFKDFTPYRGTYTPPAACGKRWSKVVLRLDGKVKGRQFDRLGQLRIGGVEVLRTSTPQPSPDGIEWSVEKDVTRYAETLRTTQPVEMLIGNVVDDTYTGILDVKATLTFYEGRPDARTAASIPDRVLTLRDDHTLTTPRNSERVVAEVHATGSGGGCEEYWYLTVPARAPYSCTADEGPYREVRIAVDGQPAGIAAPFPNVWTGGWSNPFLWYVVPGPRAFDVQPLRYDLTPFAGLLNDGRPHRIEVSVVGVPEGRPGWSTPVNVLVWQDEGSERVTGALTKAETGDLTTSSTYTPGAEHRVDTRGGDRLTVAGYVDTSHGRVTTTVRRSLAHTSTHTWADGENPDALDARWSDDETVTVDGRGPARTTRVQRSYTMDGTTTLGAGDRLRTVLTLGDRVRTTELWGGRRTAWSRLDDSYTGDATYTANVPRDQRHAVGTTGERYRRYGSDGCYDRSLVSVQGVLTEDRMGC